ncbi:glyoxalase [Pedobacter polaris]|uniref:Glyoxalase n=1 Tax=Pedobacter polaris TaxID=2571273 RepID=A0A4U1CMK4_9SPHI|nr:glyoxalase [Pedobacter polaris]TKC06543.1 glyoxalase [Pedobacter polaris]
MIEHNHDKLISAIFITFSGNCKKALSFYQTCFGGQLQFETFEKELQGYEEIPVISGSLISDRIIIHGSDLVHNEGRKIGNYISIFLHCKNTDDRQELIEAIMHNPLANSNEFAHDSFKAVYTNEKLEFDKKSFFANNENEQKLIEVTDAFDVRWVLGIQ